MKYVAIIILNYNNYRDTINCIESIEKYNTANVKYIVVDNASPNKDVPKLLHNYFREHYKEDYIRIKSIVKLADLPYMTFIECDKNEGYARGNNVALHFVEDIKEIDKILILNNDILFYEDIIPKLISQYDTINDVAILSPVLYKKNGVEIDRNCARRNISVLQIIFRNFMRYVYLFFDKKINYESLYISIDKTLNTILPIELPSGSCMMIDKKLFNKLEYFDPNTFLYFEENILFCKVKRIGLQNYLYLGAGCIHLGASTTSKTPSAFIKEKGRESMRYYVNRYSGCSIYTYMLYLLSEYVDNLFFRLHYKMKHL